GAAAPTPSGGAPQAPVSSAAAVPNAAPSRRAFDFPTPRTHFRMAYRTLPLVPQFPTIGPGRQLSNRVDSPQPQADLDPAPRHVDAFHFLIRLIEGIGDVGVDLGAAD